MKLCQHIVKENRFFALSSFSPSPCLPVSLSWWVGHRFPLSPPLLVSLSWVVMWLLVGLLACHHPRRNNPFDPALTPVVKLDPITVNDTTGTATLTWTLYKGDQPFAAYKVLRNEPFSTLVDTLTTIQEISQTSFVDTTRRPNTEYIYQVAVVNTRGFVNPSQEQRVPGYTAGAVALLDATVDPQHGTATVRWTQFRGGRFEAYRIERIGGADLDFTLRQQVTTVSDTEFVDLNLPPDTDFVYRIVVEAAGQTWTSNQSGRVRFSVATVELLDVAVDPQMGEARVRWTQFRGGRFEAYRVERIGGADLDFTLRQQIPMVSDTEFVDTNLSPDVSFFYRTVVRAAGQAWPSNRLGPVSFSLSPVQLLRGEVNNLTGTIGLTWSRYRGPGFQSYQLRRRKAGESEEQATELAKKTTLEDTVFTDQTTRAGVDYLYTVRVEVSDHDPLDSNPLDRRWTLLPITLSNPDFRSKTASATLTWSQYRGPRFRAYQVLRGTRAPTELSPQTVGEILNVNQTSFIDSGLVGNTEYVYKVVATTDSTETVESGEQSGGFHRFLSSWPVEADDKDYGRLYYEEPRDQLVLLLANPERVRLDLFDTEGHRLEGKVLLKYLIPPVMAYERLLQPIAPRSVATTLTPEGNRLLSLSVGKELFVLQFDHDGRLILGDPLPLFADSLSAPLGEAERKVAGSIRFSGLAGAAFDNVTVSRGEDILFQDDFEDGTLDGWTPGTPSTIVADGRVSATAGGPAISTSDSSWHEFRLEADVVVGQNMAQIIIGTDELNTSLLTLTLDGLYKEVRLTWQFLVRGVSRSRSLRTPFPVVGGATYRLGLEVVDGQVSASIASPVVWTTTRDEQSIWSSMVMIETVLWPIADNQPYAVSGGRGSSFPELTAFVSEIRVWEGEVRGLPAEFIGICLTQDNKILFDFFSFNKQFYGWPFYTERVVRMVGGVVGHEAGEFFYPLSFDVGPDGRLFALDAGNARIQVFNANGTYLTQWGRKGSEDGQFNFGSGGVPEDFKGSVAVDSRGSIYVLDMGNRRIQKFEP